MSSLLSRIEDRTAEVCVIGLGYVGLPMVMALVRAGYRVHGVDKDQSKVQAFSRGECYLEHVDPSAVKECTDTGRTWAHASLSSIPPCDVFLICVPTPVDHYTNRPDLQYVDSAMRELAGVVPPGALVVLESTVAPGTTRERAGWFEPGVRVAFSPEREDPGNKHYWTQNTPKLVGGVDDASLAAACTLYEAVCNEVVPVQSPEVAEMAKLFENTFRMVNIALVNELKCVCKPLGLDAWDVIKAANTKPFGFKAFWPGPGIGGHCCPIDVHYYRHKAAGCGIETRIVNAAIEVNDESPGRVADAVLAFDDVARVLVIGVAYKRDVGDVRESPALEVISELRAKCLAVAVHDPYVRDIDALASRYSFDVVRELNEDVIKAADAVLVLTDHRERVSWPMVLDNADLVLDARGFLDKHRSNVIRV